MAYNIYDWSIIFSSELQIFFSYGNSYFYLLFGFFFLRNKTLSDVVNSKFHHIYNKIYICFTFNKINI